MNKKTHTSTPRISLVTQRKDKAKFTQLQTIFKYLSKHVATASMVCKSTGIPQKSFCRHKRYLEKKGLLMALEKKQCCITHCRAWYLTTDPFKFIVITTNQTKLL